MWSCGRPLLALLLAASAAASAAPVTLAFSGEVTSDPYGLVAPGASFQGSVSFDAAASDTIGAPSLGSFVSTGPAFGFAVDVGGLAYAVPGTLTVNTANDIGVDQYGVIAQTQALDLILELFFQDTSQSALASDGLPPGAPPLAAFDVREFRLFASDAEFLGRIDALLCTAGCDTGTPVPEPGSLPLAAAALSVLVLMAARRGRRARDAVQPGPRCGPRPWR